MLQQSPSAQSAVNSGQAVSSRDRPRILMAANTAVLLPLDSNLLLLTAFLLTALLVYLFCHLFFSRRRSQVLLGEKEKELSLLDAALKNAKHEGAEWKQRFMQLANEADDIIIVHDAEGICEYANPSLQTTMGLAPHELTGQHITRLFRQENAEAMKKSMDDLVFRLNASPDAIMSSPPLAAARRTRRRPPDDAAAAGNTITQ